MVILGIIGYIVDRRKAMQQQLANNGGEASYLAHLAKIERMRLHLETQHFDHLKRVAPSTFVGIFIVLALLSYILLILYPPFLVFRVLIFSFVSIFIIYILFICVYSVLYIFVSIKIYKKSKELILYNDVHCISLFLSLTQSFYLFNKSKKPFWLALSTLLYEVGSDKSLKNYIIFSAKDQERLRKIAQDRTAARRYPDTVAGALVALRTLGGPLNRVALLNLAARKPKDKSEEWLPQSAQACLEDWETFE
jgi:hypothetical protein